MNKFLRKAMILALAGTMTLGMSSTALAEEGTTPTASNLNKSTELSDTSDTKTINLLKDYVNGSTNQSNTKSPQETFTFTVERYGLWNVGENGKGQAMYTKADMPTFLNEAGGNTFTITANENAAGMNKDLHTQLTVPTYAAVGDYWYKVTETDNNVAGVIYGTNDSKTENIGASNGNHNRVYYIHVQVINATAKGKYIRTVTLHKTAPTTNVTTNAAYENWYKENNKNTDGQADKKVNDIQNKYYAGSLKIAKVVTGNAGDKEELFKVTVVFKNESGANMYSDIKCNNIIAADGTVTAQASLGWTDTVEKNAEGTTTHTSETFTKEFYVKDGTTVTFDNIPYGVSYTITEERPANDKYTHSFKHSEATKNANGTFNGVSTAADEVKTEGTNEVTNEESANNKWNAAQATGSITDDLDTVTITNDKQSTIDVGVITSNAPYAAMLVLAGLAVLLYVRRRKNMIEE